MLTYRTPSQRPSLNDVGGFLVRRSADGVFGNQPADVGMQRRAAQKNLIGPLRIGFRKRARVAFRLRDDRLELGSRPRGHIDGDLARITWLVRVDRREPLLESIGRRGDCPREGSAGRGHATRSPATASQEERRRSCVKALQ